MPCSDFVLQINNIKIGLVFKRYTLSNLMSNHLSIAAVTQAIQHRLQTEVGRDHTGVKVSSGRPTTADSSIAGPSINVFLYQFSLNEAFRNTDLRSRRPKGSLTKRG